VNKSVVCLYLFFQFTLNFVSLAQQGSNCSEDLVPKYGQNRMWGYANLFGQWVINPIYTKVSPFIENKAVVEKGLSYGVIDCDGNVILHCDYEGLTSFRNGKIWAKKSGLWGLLNEKGIVLLQPEYTEINPIAHTELSWIKKEGLWGLYDEDKGRFICKPQFKIAQIMSENATLVQITELFGVINHVNCSYLLPLNLTRVKKIGLHDIIFLQNSKWGIFNEWGKIVTNAEYDTIYTKYEDLLEVKKEGKYGLLRIKGKEIIAVEYDSIGSFSNGFFLLVKDGKYGYSNRLGKIYIKPEYEYGEEFRDGKAIVKQNGKWGVIDYTNKFALQPQYTSVRWNKDFYVVAQDGKEFIYDKELQKKITDIAFDSVYAEDLSSHLRVKIDSKIRFFSIKAKDYISTAYEDATEFKDGYSIVENNNKWGVINEVWKLIIPFSYEKIRLEKLTNRIVFFTKQNSKYGITDAYGKIILPCEYELITNAPPNFFKVKKDGKYGIYKTTGLAVKEPIYDHITNKIEDPSVPVWPAIVSLKGKYGIINEKGEEVYPIKANEIHSLDEGFFAVKEKKDYAIFNAVAGTLSEKKYNEVKKFGSGLAPARNGKKWGYINAKGEEKDKFDYEEAFPFYEGYAIVKIGGKYGVIGVSGKYISKPEYDKYEELPNGVRYLWKDGKRYNIQENGTVR